MGITATPLAQGRLAQYDSSRVPHSFDDESVFVRVEFFYNTDPKVVAILRSPARLAPLIAHKLEDKFSLMAPVSDIPYAAREKVAVGVAWFLLEVAFSVQKASSKLLNNAF